MAKKRAQKKKLSQHPLFYPLLIIVVIWLLLELMGIGVIHQFLRPKSAVAPTTNGRQY